MNELSTIAKATEQSKVAPQQLVHVDGRKRKIHVQFGQVPVDSHALNILQSDVESAARALANSFDDLTPLAKARCLKLCGELGKLNLHLVDLLKQQKILED